jgi:hypothetical protein
LANKVHKLLPIYSISSYMHIFDSRRCQYWDSRYSPITYSKLNMSGWHSPKCIPKTSHTLTQFRLSILVNCEICAINSIRFCLLLCRAIDCTFLQVNPIVRHMVLGLTQTPVILSKSFCTSRNCANRSKSNFAILLAVQSHSAIQHFYGTRFLGFKMKWFTNYRLEM